MKTAEQWKNELLNAYNQHRSILPVIEEIQAEARAGWREQFYKERDARTIDQKKFALERDAARFEVERLRGELAEALRYRVLAHEVDLLRGERDFFAKELEALKAVNSHLNEEVKAALALSDSRTAKLTAVQARAEKAEKELDVIKRCLFQMQEAAKFQTDRAERWREAARLFKGVLSPLPCTSDGLRAYDAYRAAEAAEAAPAEEPSPAAEPTKAPPEPQMCMHCGEEVVAGRICPAPGNLGGKNTCGVYARAMTDDERAERRAKATAQPVAVHPPPGTVCTCAVCCPWKYVISDQPAALEAKETK